jgi:hypothetical protein
MTRELLRELDAPPAGWPLFLEAEVDQPDERFVRVQIFGKRGPYERELLQVFTLTVARIRLAVDRER